MTKPDVTPTPKNQMGVSHRDIQKSVIAKIMGKSAAIMGWAVGKEQTLGRDTAFTRTEHDWFAVLCNFLSVQPLLFVQSFRENAESVVQRSRPGYQNRGGGHCLSLG
jgi:hypothetical protein